MEWHRFYSQWLRTAFWHPLGVAALIAGIIGVLLPVLEYFLPGLKVVLSDLARLLPLAVFGVLALPRLILAPYWLYNNKISELEVELNSVREQFETREKLRASTVALNRFISECNSLDWQLRRLDDVGELPKYIDQAEKWRLAVLTFLQGEFPEFVGQFESDAGLPFQGVLVGSKERAGLVNYLQRRSARLGELLARMQGLLHGDTTQRKQ